MTTSKQALVLKLIDAELTNKSHGTNYDIYERRLTPGYGKYGYVPRCMYFYYVRINEDGTLAIDHYFYCNGPITKPKLCKPIFPKAVPALVKRLALNGRPEKKNKPRWLLPKGKNFSKICWRRKAYIAIYFDEANWQFYRRGKKKASVVFNVSEGGCANQTFYDARDLTLDMPNDKLNRTDKRTAIVFINHMKKDDGGADLKEGEKQKFKFDMYLRAKFAKGSKSAMTIIFDPPSENQGPPLQP